MTARNILFTTILLLLGFVPLSPPAQAVVPPPDGGYPNFNTAEGQNALMNLTTGAGNTAVGWSSLLSVSTGSFNTAVGAGTLFVNTADQNTAMGGWSAKQSAFHNEPSHFTVWRFFVSPSVTPL
jgi:hypothetical protein